MLCAIGEGVIFRLKMKLYLYLIKSSLVNLNAFIKVKANNTIRKNLMIKNIILVTVNLQLLFYLL
jgi:hypothetical protein